MKKCLCILLVLIVLSLSGYTQSESIQKICFHFIDKYGSIVKPHKVEIVDNQGDFFQLSTNEYCFDYFTTPNYAFEIKISDTNFYDYRKTYRTSIPETDTIVLSNMIIHTKFFIKSDTFILTDDELAFLAESFSKSKYGFTSLHLEIHTKKYDIADFQNVIVQIYNLYSRDLLNRNIHDKIEFSVDFKNDVESVRYFYEEDDDLENSVFYLFEGNHFR